MAYSHVYNLRPRRNKVQPSTQPVARPNRRNRGLISTKGKLLVQWPAPKKNKRNNNNNNSNTNNKKEKKEKKEYAEPTHIKAIYWVKPVKTGDDYFINVEWHGLPGLYGESLSGLLDSSEVWQLSNECQLGHGEYGGFSGWFMERAELKRSQLRIGDIVYDEKEKKYYAISGMPRNNQLYVWPGYDNYFVAIGRELDAYGRIIGGGDGFISDVDYYLYSKEIIAVGNLAQFYMEQNAKDFWYHILENKLNNQFKKNGKAKRLQFFENVDGKIWRHYIKKKLSDYEENIDVGDGGHVKRWNLSLDQANNLFPVSTGSLFEKVIGIRKYYVDDMDFIFDIKRNKLRIYSVILVENTKTHAINGNDIEKR